LGFGAVLMLLHVAAIAGLPAPSGNTQWAGLGLYTLALTLFWSAVDARSADRPDERPHGIVRPPFYTAYTLAWTAGAVATAQPVLLLAGGVMAVLYWRAAELEERACVDSDIEDPTL